MGSLGLHEVIVHVDVDNEEDTYARYVSEVRNLYMFYVGLDADLAALWNDVRRCTILTYATMASCLLLAAFVSGGMYGSMMHTPVRSPELLAAVLMLTLANTASVDVSRMVGEMGGLAATPSGQLLVSTAAATNVMCIVGEGVLACMKLASSAGVPSASGYYYSSASQRLRVAGVALVKLGAGLALLRPGVAFLNRRHAGRRRVGNWEVVLLLACVSLVSRVPEVTGFDGMPAALLLGLVFPREGPAARSVAAAMAYPLHALALPFYFGSMGMRLNFNSISGAIVVPAVLVTMLGLVGKCVGTVGAARFLKMPVADAVRFGVLLNVKGHVNMIDMTFASSQGIWAEQALMAMVVGSMISTLIAGPVLAEVFRKERNAYACSPQALEHAAVTDAAAAEEDDHHLRMLACVRNARCTPGMLSILELLSSKPWSQPALHMLHFYNLVDGRDAAATQVTCAVDVFACATGLAIRQVDAADRGTTANAKAVRRWTEDVRAGVLLVPYHKDQHFDGRMVCRREDRVQFNREVLERAPCTACVLADRPFRSGGATFQLPAKMSTTTDKLTTHVAAIFLGGPDDREALALACRLARTESVTLTLVRFLLPRSGASHDDATETRGDDAAVQVVVHGDAAGGVVVSVADPDEACVAAFRREYVAKERAEYAERAVAGPADVVEALRGMAGAYALLVAGRGGRQPTELVAGLEGWAECKEVGPVGEILASDESLEMGSVLVVQQKTVPPPLQPDLPA